MLPLRQSLLLLLLLVVALVLLLLLRSITLTFEALCYILKSGASVL
jgi:hypothetical protein